MAEPVAGDPLDLVAQIVGMLDEGVYVTKYVMVVEVIGPDGSRSALNHTSDDATYWDTYGLLLNALQETKLAHAEQHTARGSEEEDDD